MLLELLSLPGRQNWPFPQGAGVLGLGTLEEAWCRRQGERRSQRLSSLEGAAGRRLSLPQGPFPAGYTVISQTAQL